MLNHKLIIREAEINDITKINQLIIDSVDFYHSKNFTLGQLKAWKDGYSPSKLEKTIQQRLSYVLVFSNKIIGFIQFDNPEIKGFYIHPNNSRKGYGSILMQYMLDTLQKRGHQRAELTSNLMAIPFYQQMGFKIIKEEVVVWDNQPFHEFRMMKELYS